MYISLVTVVVISSLSLFITQLFCSLSQSKQKCLFPPVLPFLFPFFPPHYWLSYTCSLKELRKCFDYELAAWAVSLLQEMNLSWLGSRTCFPWKRSNHYKAQCLLLSTRLSFPQRLAGCQEGRGLVPCCTVQHCLSPSATWPLDL